MKIKLLCALAALALWGCTQNEEVPNEMPPGFPGNRQTGIDSAHRPPVIDTDTMIDLKTGKPKTGETDTI